VTDAIIQPMPELTPEQWDALAADILANGVLVPVVKDQHGRIIDGNNRAAIADRLGIDYPVRVVEVADDDDAWDRAVSLNCARRHLNREQTRELIRAEILRRPADSDRAISKRVGCSPTTVGSVRAEIQAERDRLAAEERRRAQEQTAQERRRAEELTEQIRREFDNLQGRVAVIAFLRHRDDGTPWQTVGDVMERMIRGRVGQIEPEIAADDVWGPLWGPLFDEMRGYDCPADCAVCTDFDRQWRREHPGQVYRWSEPPAEVSNLDTAEGAL
jgi:hypothetical protein